MPETVHCLECDNEFLEQEPIIEVCPHCGNEDKQRTVYRQPETLEKENA